VRFCDILSTMTWTKCTQEIKALAKKIDYTPDIIVGIARGGIIPAVLCAESMGVKDMYCLKVRRKGNTRKVIAEVFTDVTKKKVLVIDEMQETGRSMNAIKKYLEKKGAEVKTACPYIMPHTSPKPDFYLREVKKVQKFPWE